MTALALHDINAPASAASPTTQLSHPLNLFQENAVHGGTWRCAFKTNSYTEVSALLHYGAKIGPWAAAVAGGSLFFDEE
jgi:hypothetical protein